MKPSLSLLAATMAAITVYSQFAFADQCPTIAPEDFEQKPITQTITNHETGASQVFYMYELKQSSLRNDMVPAKTMSQIPVNVAEGEKITEVIFSDALYYPETRQITCEYDVFKNTSKEWAFAFAMDTIHPIDNIKTPSKEITDPPRAIQWMKTSEGEAWVCETYNRQGNTASDCAWTPDKD